MLSKIAVNRPVTTSMVILIVIAFGVLSITNLKMDMMPNMNIPYAIASTTYSGAGPEEIEKLVTSPLENVLGTVAGIKEIQSISSNGSSLIALEFEDGTNIDNAALDMREKIDMVKGVLPDGANDPMVMKLDINSMSSINIGISSPKYNIVDLRNLIEERIQNRLERQDGVASASISGGVDKEISVVLNDEKLRGYGITESQILQLISAENRTTPTGTIKQGDKSLPLRVMGDFESIEDIQYLPITTSRGANVYLRDVALVSEVYKENTSLAYINGIPGINLNVQKQSTANTVSVSNAILKEIESIQKDYPELDVKLLFDPADMIRMTLSSVSSSAFGGGLLAVIILFIFLRNFKTTLIVAASMPISIIATFVLMYYANITLNIMSLGGLALGIGMLVDNSIVVLESVYRKIEEGENNITSAIEGTREVAMAVTSSTLTTVAVFLPISFAGGMAAMIFNELSLTIAFSLASSLFVSLTFVPMACSVILRPKTEEQIKLQQSKKRFSLLMLPFDLMSYAIEKMESGYEKALSTALNHRKITLVVTVAFIILTMLSMRSVGMEFLPSGDEGMVSVTIDMPLGTLLEDTHETTKKVVERIEGYEEVTDIIYTIGGGSMFQASGADTGSITILLVDKQERERSAQDIALAMSKDLTNIAGAEITVSASQSAMGNFAGGGIDVGIKGEDLTTLDEISRDVSRIMSDVPGTSDVKTTMEDSTPQATIKINRIKASAYGISASSVSSIVNTAVVGQVVTTYKVDGDEFDIRLRQDKNNFDYITDIKNIVIPSPYGVNVPLYEIADISIESMPVAINKINQEKYISVTATIDGRTSGEVSADFERAMASYIMPNGYRWEFAGTAEQMTETFASLGLALIMAILLVYMIMAAQFESLIYPFIVMFAIPIALTGGLFGLFVMKDSLSVTGYLGLIMLAGVVINNAIVLVDYTNLLIREREMSVIDALKRSGPVRLRPILMSTLTTVLGLVPIMLSNGQGSEMMRGLGTVVVFGLTLSTLVTLLFVPCVYLVFNNIKVKRIEKKQLRLQKRLAKI